MHVSRVSNVGGLALCALLMLACGDEGDPPAISNLAYGPATIASGQQSNITGSLRFDDADGDLAQLGVAFTLPNGTVQELPLTSLQGYTGQTTGQVALTLALVPPMAGRYTFDVWLTDGGGHTSNRLSGTLQAQ